ncbi:MAG: nuclear transport factor 2 family protein [Candidatus Dormibacteraeota bacterium]|uniref:Nuclear transport factor 2 family protein n=1 Tax=Candidatus Amunia macphersoniae TaxID=3127014 RepID=A0A934KFJ2_9BACT|nr:nuclear transport factor 2 family protein [Candidatus Dormibacteraeota bacterium]
MIAAGALAGCGGSSAATPAPTASPVTATSVAQQLFDRLGAGDASAAGALLASDASWSGGPGCSPVKCVGSNVIQKIFATRVKSHPHYSLSNFVETGQSATFNLQVTSDRVRAAGADRVLVNDTLTIKDGKAAAVTETFDMTDAQTSMFVKFTRDHSPPQGGPAPGPTSA